MYSHDHLLQACKSGNVHATQFLLQRFDPSEKDNEAIYIASLKGHVSIVKILLADTRVDPAAGFDAAIRVASSSGHSGVVKLLLSDPRVDASACRNSAIRYANLYGHEEVVKLLLTQAKVLPTMKMVQNIFKIPGLTVEFFLAAADPVGLEKLLPLAGLCDGLTLEVLDILISRAQGIRSNQKFLHLLRLQKPELATKMPYGQHLLVLFGVRSSDDVLKLANFALHLSLIGFPVESSEHIFQYF